MSIFRDLDLNSVPADPILPDDEYLAEVVNYEVREHEVTHPEHLGSVARGLVFIYEILEGPYREWQVESVSQPCNTWDSRQRKAWLRRRLHDHGIPEKQDLTTVNPGTIVGQQVWITVRGGRAVKARVYRGYNDDVA